MSQQVIEIADDVTELIIRILPAHTQHFRGELGIDVSRHNGEVNWDAMKQAGVGFAGIRSSMGVTGKDDQFARNWAEAKRVGIQRLAYHYFVNNIGDGLGQSQNFRACLGNDLGELWPVLDVERAGGQVINNRSANTIEIAACLSDIAHWAGKKPIIYTNKSAWDACTDVPSWSANYLLWHAQYTTAPLPKVNPPWTSCLIWQYSSTGKIGGQTAVDLNRYGPYP